MPPVYNNEQEMGGIVTSMTLFDQLPAQLRELISERSFNLVITPELFWYFKLTPFPQAKRWLESLPGPE